MRVLVTGGAGFIGSHVVDLLLARGDEVHIIDNLDPQVHPKARNKKFPFLSLEWPDYTGEQCVRNGVPTKVFLHYGDISDGDWLDARMKTIGKLDACIHLAAKVGVGQSATDPGDYMQTNAAGTGHLLQALARHSSIGRLVVASSMSCYGEGCYVPEGMAAKHALWKVQPIVDPSSLELRPPLRSISDMERGDWDHVLISKGHDGVSDVIGGLAPVGIAEYHRLEPTSIYAESKATTERCALIWGEQQGVPVAALRFFNVYGPRQALSNPYTGVAAIFSSALLRGEAPQIYEDGLQSRDFVHVHDVAAAVVLLTAGMDSDFHGPINVGTGQATTILALAEGLRERLGGPEPVVNGRFRAGDIRHCIADSGALRAFGWKPTIYLNSPEGLDALADWARSLPPDATDVGSINPHAELDEQGLLLGESK